MIKHQLKIRQDIQCLRGIAILLVLLFHLWPNIFVNGFLGVDIFFVISGFLMSKNLTYNELININDFFQFYYKRFRRILPLYYLTILGTVVLVHLCFAHFLWKNNDRYSLASLFLVTNQLVIQDQSDYFKEFLATTSSANSFLHLWSLSVEMQFYLLVPFIFFALQFLKHDYLKLIAVSIVTVVGFLAFVLAAPHFSFNFMLLRLWQFSAGFIALFWTRMNQKKLPEKTENPNIIRIFKSPINQEEGVIISISILSLCLLPNVINVKMFRPLVTLATAFIIASDPQDNKIFNSKTLMYIGDISYVMYLVHWPIISVFYSPTFEKSLFCILLILISSVLLHHLFEKQYLKLDMKSLFSLVILLLVFNAYSQYSIRYERFWKDNLSKEDQMIIEKNINSEFIQRDLAEKNCIENNLQMPLMDQSQSLLNCRYAPGNGNFSVMVLGNSYGQHIGENLRTHFQNNYSDFKSISLIGNFVLYGGDHDYSQNAMAVSMNQVEVHKPDVLIIINRYMEEIKRPIREKDELLEEMNRNMAYYEKYVKKVYILGEHPLYPDNFMYSFLHAMYTKPENIESLHLNKIKADYEMRNVKRRFKILKCQKCHFFDLSHVFIDNDKYLTFDRDTFMSYVDNSIHITEAGMKLCDPVLKTLSREIMDSF